MGVKLCTREDVKSALEFGETARANARVDRAIETASRLVESLCGRRHFHPVLATRTLDWPPEQLSRSFSLDLHRDELISITSMTAGGVAIVADDRFLRPDSGPPYTRIEIDLASTAAFSANASTHQRAISITGLFGYSDESAPAGALSEALDAIETAVDVTNSAAIGVGSLIKVDSERMIVTDKTMIDTGQNLGGNLAASNASITVPVTTGSDYALRETILIDAERMLIVEIAGNNLIVERAYDGSVLATHATGADVYAPRTLTVERGAVGTTAAIHASAAAITTWRPPALAHELALAEAINIVIQSGAGWARSIGSGENVRELSGRGLIQLRAQVESSLSRARTRKYAI